ncbi:MAG: ExbD/TolR family protein [Verrucomicrobiota bacterium]
MQFYTRRKRIPTINIVSLIDVMTILLIFFVVTTTFKKDQPKVQIDLPESTKAEKSLKKNEPVTIYVSKDEKISVGAEQNVPLENLARILKAKKSTMQEPLFALEADKEVPLGFFVKVLDASKEAGIENLSLHTKEPEGTPKDTP